MEFIPRVTPRWEAPFHLRPYIEVLEQAIGGNLRICFSAPPQHGKTESTIHAIVWWLKKHPELRFAYATYAGDRAARVSRKAKDVAERAFAPLSTANMDYWATPKGGQVLWTSVGGGLTGEPIDGVMVIDDPLKDRAEAESPTIRQNHIDWWHGSVESRLHPGASVIVMMTRWHPEDLAGYLTNEQGFEYVNLKAIADEDRPPGDNRQVGEALWESKRPLAGLQQRQQANQWNFAALYQGQPQPRGGTLFHAPTYYRDLPEHGFRVTYGLDLAYTKKKRRDFSVSVELWVVPPPYNRKVPAKIEDYLFYVVNVERKQVEAPMFTLTLKAQFSTRRAKFFMYAAGTELGAITFIRDKGIPIVAMDTGGRDKLTRALQSSELWNTGRILVPEDVELNPWQPQFVGEVTSFTGADDAEDDDVDALVSGVDAALKYTDDLGVLGSGGRYA